MAPIRHIRSVFQYFYLDGVVEALPSLTQLTGLEFWGLYGVEDEHLRALLTSPHLQGLRTLILYHDRNGNLADEDVLIEGLLSPYRSNLRCLAVNIDETWRGPSERVIRAMIGSPYLKRVQKLSLSHAEPAFSVDLLHGLFHAMPRLCRIDLHACAAPEASWEVLLDRARNGKLKRLRLSDAELIAGEDHRTCLSDIERYTNGFRESGVRVDWCSEFIDPWNGGCWKGYSWVRLSSRHLSSMWPYVEAKRFQDLVADYRRDCQQHAGEEAAAAVDAMSFDQFKSDVNATLPLALDEVEHQPETNGIYLHIILNSWTTEIKLLRDRESEPFRPRTADGFSPTATFPMRALGEASEICERFREKQAALDPDSLEHYLFARTIQAFAQCLVEIDSPLPIYFDCGSIVLKIHP